MKVFYKKDRDYKKKVLHGLQLQRRFAGFRTGDGELGFGLLC